MHGRQARSLGTGDAHLVALDIKTGDVLWDRELADLHEGLLRSTVAPLVVKDKVIVGMAGSRVWHPWLHRSVRREYRQKVLEVLHRGRPDQPGGQQMAQGIGFLHLRGGGSIWVTGTDDPDQNLVFFGTGNPGPDYFSPAREGRQPVYVLCRCTGRRYRPDEVALPVHAARLARLGLDASPGARGSDDQRHAA